MTRPRAELRLPRWVQRLDTLPEEIVREALEESRDFLRDKARENASKGGNRGLHVRSGRLIASLRTYLRPTSNGGELGLGVVSYGWVNDRGAVIRAKNAPYLRFRGADGRWYSRKQVTIPERPWARDALEATRKEFPRYVYRALERATRP
ncbi:hypothetical protein [Deinococcus sp. Marseille-Q6407]|uniref:hypothetical protein n=1 Tax=Deinococcus sp. Marseille-Q6407 TaxID=2969223 RepID=UPI0021BE67A8|nr:hypothetical protein [Deinococcus sp. Marseille-Q6407]